MKLLAIKGRSQSDNPQLVIDVLTHLGAENKYDLSGNSPDSVYAIDANGCVLRIKSEEIKQINPFNIYSVEEFWDAFPYKTGEKVVYKLPKFDLMIECEVIKARWDNVENTVIYSVKDGDSTVDVIASQIYYNNGHFDKVCQSGEIVSETEPINKIVMSNKYEDRVEVDLGDDYEIIVEDGKTFITKKSAILPKTYFDACDILGVSEHKELCYDNYSLHDHTTDYEYHQLDLMESLRRLIICRDAFWAVLSWKPDWNDQNTVKHVMYFQRGKLETNLAYTSKNILAFPDDVSMTKFKERFDVYIKACEELL